MIKDILLNGASPMQFNKAFSARKQKKNTADKNQFSIFFSVKNALFQF
jgi:hypothetical protein